MCALAFRQVEADRRHTPLLDLFEALAGRCQGCSLAAILLPAANGDIHVLGIELESPSFATATFRSNEDGAAAAEWIKHKTSAPRAVFDCIGNHGHGFY